MIGIHNPQILIDLFIFKKKDKESKELPWEGRQSIYDHIKNKLDSDGKVKEEGLTLPDETLFTKPGEIGWMPGAADGSYVTHIGGGGNIELAKQVASLVRTIGDEDSLDAKTQLYEILSKKGVLDYIDPALRALSRLRSDPRPYVHEHARWLAAKAPDRGPVKFGIALLGIIGHPADLDTIRVLGKHEEFTLYSAVAITNILEDPVFDLVELARYVDGWGKIHLVERIAKSEDPQVKDWLLREGYKNNVYHEYTAHICATRGDLKSALSQETIDDELLSGAGAIIVALVGREGPPAEDISDYEDGVVVVEEFLRRVKDRVSTLGDFLMIKKIALFLDYPCGPGDDPQKLERLGWTESKRQDLKVIANDILSRPLWRDKVREYMTRDDINIPVLWQSARWLGMDIWDELFEMLQEDSLNSSLWWYVMDGVNKERIEKVVDLAVRVIPLKVIATGPAREFGMGREFQMHHILGTVLEKLGDYPALGFPLVEAGIRSPVISDRVRALRVLSAWGKENWNSGVKGLLNEALSMEPDKTVREKIERVQSGLEAA